MQPFHIDLPKDMPPELRAKIEEHAKTFLHDMMDQDRPKKVADRVMNSVRRLHEYLDQASDVTMKFYDISDMQRDIFMKSQNSVTIDPHYEDIMGVKPGNADKHFELKANLRLPLVGQEFYDKTVIHEFSHWLDETPAHAAHTTNTTLYSKGRFAAHLISLANIPTYMAGGPEAPLC